MTIYLASPYSSPDPEVREARYIEACRAAARIMGWGHLVYSPIAHSHGIATHGGVAGDWGTWKLLDRLMLGLADEVWVLALAGWEDSEGVREEIRIAREAGKPCWKFWPLNDQTPAAASRAGDGLQTEVTDADISSR